MLFLRELRLKKFLEIRIIVEEVKILVEGLKDKLRKYFRKQNKEENGKKERNIGGLVEEV